MKVTRNRGASAPVGAKKADASTGVQPAPAVAPATQVSIAGIPEAELTPKVRAALSALMEEVATLRQQLADTQNNIAELTRLADTDPLLGVLNRRAFVAALDRTLAFADRYDQSACLVYFDLNNMKAINDDHGHAAGDAALKHTAGVIASSIRQTDVLGRLGGDEFGVILSHVDKPTALTKMEELIARIGSEPFHVNDNAIAVTVTGGLAEIKKGATSESILTDADEAMYKKKKNR